MAKWKCPSCGFEIVYHEQSICGGCSDAPPFEDEDDPTIILFELVKG